MIKTFQSRKEAEAFIVTADDDDLEYRIEEGRASYKIAMFDLDGNFIDYVSE